MSEEENQIPRLLLFLVTKSFALLASFALILGGSVAWWLQERLDTRGMLGMASGLSGILLATVWTAVTVTARLKTKISKLERELLSLQSRASPALKNATDLDVVLVEVNRAGDAYARFPEMLGFSQTKVDDCFHKLKASGMIEFQLGQPWENNSRYAITPKGRDYLLQNHLVE